MAKMTQSRKYVWHGMWWINFSCGDYLFQRWRPDPSKGSDDTKVNVWFRTPSTIQQLNDGMTGYTCSQYTELLGLLYPVMKWPEGIITA